MTNTVLLGIRTFIFFICSSILLLFNNLKANDGEFYGGGGGILFPVFNDNVSVKKEVLKISHTKNWRKKRYESDREPLHIEVDYEIYNHGAEQELLIGFESMLGGEHNDVIPDIANFKVNINGLIVPYESKIINDPYALLNNDNGNRLDSIYSKDSSGQPNRYIKYFKALFKHGSNTIHHSYECGFTNTSVGPVYSFEYDLMPAMRWKNRQIDDFTLILDFGNLSHYLVSNMTKLNSNKWTFIGNGKVNTIIDSLYSDGEDSMNYTQYSNIYCKEGKVEYRCKNFKPINNLDIIFANPIESFFISVPNELSYSPDYDDESDDDESDNNRSLKEYFYSIKIDATLAKRIYRNLPFARRGYIFKDKLLSDFYKKHTSWYEPNPKYNGNIKDFTIGEKKIIKKSILLFKK